MRKLISSIVAPVLLLVAALGSFAPLASAQANQSYLQRWFYASDFGQWSVPSQTANVYQWQPGSLCLVPPTGTVSAAFFPFNTNAPVYIQDATPANSETVTPSATTNTNAACSITISPANQHYSFQVRSGTGGLQETLNNIAAQNVYPAVVWLDKNFYALANAVPGTNAQTIIANVVGNSAVRLVDNTTTPFQYYAAGTNGKYTIIGTPTGGSSNPTAAAGAAAGTSPTGPTNSSGNGNWFNVALTTGTATTTGTLFTETWATSNAFLYPPACSVTSTGSNSFTAFTTAVTYPSGTHAVLTVTATAAPVASTAYAFHVVCQ